MIRKIIVAMGQDRAIGKDNDLMWSLPVDMKFFRSSTLGHAVIMGRKNWESIPEKYRPLAQRKNIVLTRQDKYHIEDAIVAHSLESALVACEASGEEECYIIGGGEIYRLALESDLVDEMYITVVDATFPEADTFFPEYNEKGWSKEEIQQKEPDDKHLFGFRIFRLVKK